MVFWFIDLDLKRLFFSRNSLLFFARHLYIFLRYYQTFPILGKTISKWMFANKVTICSVDGGIDESGVKVVGAQDGCTQLTAVF